MKYNHLANCEDDVNYIKKNKNNEHSYLYSALMELLGPPFKTKEQEDLYDVVHKTYDAETQSFSKDSELESVYDRVYDEACETCSFFDKPLEQEQSSAYEPTNIHGAQPTRIYNKNPYLSNKNLCNLRNYKSKKYNLRGCHLEGGNFFAEDFEDYSLEGSNLKNSNFENAHLQKSSLVGANLENANFQGTNLNEANFSRANLSSAQLNYAKMTKTKLKQSTLIKTNLSHARFEEVDARKANFQGASLISAKLRRSNFEMAYFVKADFTEADIEGSHFKGANLSEAILKDVTGMVESCPEEMPDSYECDKDKKNSFFKDDSWF